MLHCFILIAVGFVMWKYLPGKITAASKKTRSRIDLCLQVLGITLMLTGAVQLVKALMALITH